MLKDIEGFEGLYAVNETGQVWSYPKTCQVGARGGTVVRGGVFIRQHRMKRCGHLRVWLCKDGKRYPQLVHRLVAKAFLPNNDNLPIINHKECNPQNNRVENLEWCTYKHNSKHAYVNGRWTPPVQVGSKNSNAIFSEQDIVAIRERHQIIKNCSQVAREYGVNPKVINDIVNFRRWSHVG